MRDDVTGPGRRGFVTTTARWFQRNIERGLGATTFQMEERVNHMKTNFKRGIATGALALSLLGGSAAGVVAQNTNQGQQGGAAGLVAAVV